MNQLVLFLFFLQIPLVAQAEGNWNIPVTGQLRVFPNVPQYSGQSYNGSSISVKPKYQNSLSKDSTLRFEPFYRYDEHDTNRTHADIRELSYSLKKEGAQWTLGISKVFWGVTETQHLVDIVNQTDFVETPDGSEKLGQPMIHYDTSTQYGNWDLFLLVGFREKTYPGVSGRLRTPLAIDPTYTERVRKSDIDFAARWSEQFDRFDLGISLFYGSARDPHLRFNNFTQGASTYMIANYDEISQLGIDAQYTLEKVIWKTELIYRNGVGTSLVETLNQGKNPNDFFAASVGGEYILGSIKGTDLGLLAEYSYDTRNGLFVAFQNDYFIGLRWTLNDAYESNMFIGTAIDAVTNANTLNFRYNRRIYENLSLNIRTLTLSHIPDPANDPYASVQNDSFFEINLTQYFLF